MDDMQIIDRCLGVDDGHERCIGNPPAGEVLCSGHIELRDSGVNFMIAIVPLSEFHETYSTSESPLD